MALENDTRSKLGLSTKDDTSQLMVEDEEADISAGFEEVPTGAQIVSGGGPKEGKSKVESIISSNAATHFSPNV